MYSNIPFLDTVEISGIASPISWESELEVLGLPNLRGQPFKKIEEIEKELPGKYNRKRGLKVAQGVKQNAIIREAALDYAKKCPTPLTLAEEQHFMDFIRSIGLCCHHSCFREYVDGAKEYIGSHTCKHKSCAVCNVQRSKKTRRVWRSFFEKNPDLIQKYDFLHLTLTVPHDANGWKGKKWYSQELIKLYNQLRKNKQWKELVYGGEFGVEVTRNEKGFHIHVHSLILAKRYTKQGLFIKQNRNKLHRLILTEWNKLTAGSATKTSFTTEEKESIAKGNSLLSANDLDMLDPSGATLIGLESLYITSKELRPGYKWCDRSKAYKRYVRPSDPQNIFLAGVMECIKYHFEPMAMMKNGVYDFDMLREILPATKNKRMYGKFGAFYASKNAHPDAKMLSLSYKSDAEELIEDLEEMGREQVLHPDTGEPVEREDFNYFLVSMAKVFFDADDEYRIKLSANANPMYLHVRSCVDALKFMEELAGKNSSRSKNHGQIRWRKTKNFNSFSNYKNHSVCLN